MSFLFKLLRNALIVSGFYFVSTWATIDAITLEIYKPAIVSVILYVLAELTHHYKVNAPKTKLRASLMLIF
jgi:hypothetical protein